MSSHLPSKNLCFLFTTPNTAERLRDRCLYRTYVCAYFKLAQSYFVYIQLALKTALLYRGGKLEHVREHEIAVIVFFSLSAI